MTITGGEIKDRVLERLQMSGSVAYTDAFFYDILSKVQNVVNSSFELNVATGTLNTIPSAFFYPLYWHLPNALRVLDLSKSDVTIQPLKSWRELGQYAVAWRTVTTADSFSVWATIGRDMLILYPAKAAADTVDVRYVECLTALTADASTFGLDEDYLGVVMDITELIFLTHQRELTAASKKLESIVKQFQTLSDGRIQW